jgi:hypothetical protein
MVKQARWQCPKCGDGKLAPRRPRRNDTRRYCLPCSDKTGRLVQRQAPSLERLRQKAAEEAREAALDARAEAQEMAVTWPHVLQETWKVMCRLPGTSPGPSSHHPGGKRPFRAPILELLPHVPKKRLGTSYGGKVTIRIGAYTTELRCDESQTVIVRGRGWTNNVGRVVGTMLHELAHEILKARFGTSRPDGQGPHGKTFQSALGDLIDEWHETELAGSVAVACALGSLGKHLGRRGGDTPSGLPRGKDPSMRRGPIVPFLYEEVA